MSARAIVLGTAQDGGFPHAGCMCPNCEGARAEPAHARRVACLGLIGESGQRLLIDATPDIGEQLVTLSREAGAPKAGLEALVLTHAHMGHYVGLAQLGREAMSVRGLRTLGTDSMKRFVTENRPWAHLVTRGEIEFETLRPGQTVTFDGLELTAFLSPHRAEDTDTIGLEVNGPAKSLLYLPDADFFPDPIVERIESVDVALIDATFHDKAELPGREILAVKHPFVVETIERITPRDGRTVWFTHLNHTNALLAPAGAPSLPTGFAVAADGQSFAL